MPKVAFKDLWDTVKIKYRWLCKKCYKIREIIGFCNSFSTVTSDGKKAFLSLRLQDKEIDEHDALYKTLIAKKNKKRKIKLSFFISFYTNKYLKII